MAAPSRSPLTGLRIRLLGLVLVAALPAMGLVLYSGYQQRREAEARSLAQARHLTDLACSNIDNAIHDARVLLQSLSQVPAVREGDPVASEKLFREVLRRGDYYIPRSTLGAGRAGRSGARPPGEPESPVSFAGPYSAIALADLEGRILASTPPAGKATSIEDRPYFQLALATHTFAFGAYPMGRARPEPGVGAAYRVLNPAGAVRGALVVGIDVGRLSADVAGGLLPRDGRLMVLDSRGTVLARYPNPVRFTGSAYPDAPVVHEVLTRREGVVEAVSIEGDLLLWSFRPVTVTPRNNIYVALGFRPGSVFAEADSDTQRMALVVAVVLAVTALALWWWARRFILSPVDALMGATRRLSEGDRSARTRLETAGELGDLARSFDDMAAEIQSRDRELERALTALRASNETLEAVLTTAPTAIVATDSQDGITLWTPEAERLFGWSSAEVLGRPLPSILPEHALESRARMARLDVGERLPGEERVLTRKDGTRMALSVSTAALADAEGRVTGLVSSFVDLTLHHLLERQLRNAQKMDAVGRLADGVAHEFNNLLTAIQGLSEIVLTRDGLDPASRQDIESVFKVAVRGSEFTGRLLAFGHHQVPRPRLMDVNVVVTDMAALLQRLIGEDVTLETRLGAPLALVHGDPGQIEQVITNLAVNAREAMPGGGRLVIETANVPGPVEPGRSRPSSEPCLALMVSDTGPGMDAEALEHVFEPVFAPQLGGADTGLGLAAVYRIVQQWGADIEVTSGPGLGSRFRILLPLAQGVETEAPPQPAAGTFPRGSGTVLLVEDDDVVREVARAALEKSGYRVLQARQGNEALEVAQQHAKPVDLLLTDLVMPQMGGLELAQRMRQAQPGIKVLYFSGYVTGEGLIDGQELDAAFLPKPFRPSELTLKVREVMAGPSPGGGPG